VTVLDQASAMTGQLDASVQDDASSHSKISRKALMIFGAVVLVILLAAVAFRLLDHSPTTTVTTTTPPAAASSAPPSSSTTRGTSPAAPGSQSLPEDPHVVPPSSYASAPDPFTPVS